MSKIYEFKYVPQLKCSILCGVKGNYKERYIGAFKWNCRLAAFIFGLYLGCSIQVLQQLS